MFNTSPQSIIIMFVGITTFETLVSFDWLVNQVECSNVISTTNFTEGVILCKNIRDEHQLIGYCLIPLDTWV